MTPSALIMPPRHSTTASAIEQTNAVPDMNRLRKCICFKLSRFISAVSPSNSVSVLSSMTSVFMVFAPLMPSLNAEVICEFDSLTLRWYFSIFF